MTEARKAYESRGSGESTTGWKVDTEQRKELLQQFPPRFAEVVADHVTLASGAADDAPLPEETDGEIIARVEDPNGVEAMVVRVGGTNDRPDGGTYHITWSLADGHEAKESNQAIREQPWQKLDLPMPVTLHPARWP